MVAPMPETPSSDPRADRAATRRRFLGAAAVAGAAGLAGGPPAAAARRRSQGPPAFEDVVVDTGDVLLAARVIGHGDPVVIHPSLARGARDFDALAVRLAAHGHRVIAFDPRGIGQSWAPPATLEGRTLHDYAADMLAVMDRFGLRRAHVLGHAYGNRVARTLATDHPGRVRTVVLCACGGGIPSPAVVAGLARVTTPETSAAEIRRTTREVFFAPGNDPSPWYLGWYAAGGRAEQQSVGATDFAAVEGGGRAPMLIVQGKDDVVAPPGLGHDLRRRFGARITVRDLARAGHAMVTERPDAVARAILPYLRRHPIRR